MKYRYRIVEYDGRFYPQQKLGSFLSLCDWDPIKRDGTTGRARWPHEDPFLNEADARKAIELRKASHRQWEATEKEHKRKARERRIIKVR